MISLRRLPAAFAIALVRVYQLALSPLLGKNCRYEPSCSKYMIQAIEKYGLLLGGWKGTLRLLRCHPWSKGGWDPP